MYDLGDVRNARNWFCTQGGFPLPDKYLFANAGDDDQFVGRFAGYYPVIAVGQARAVGNGGDARILNPSQEVVRTLFGPIADGGLGLNKLEFYSPSNGFRYLPTSPAFPQLRRLTRYNVNIPLNSLNRLSLSEPRWHSLSEPHALRGGSRPAWQLRLIRRTRPPAHLPPSTTRGLPRWASSATTSRVQEAARPKTGNGRTARAQAVARPDRPGRHPGSAPGGHL